MTPNHPMSPEGKGERALKLRMQKQAEASGMRQMLLLWLQDLQLKIYVSRIVGLQNNLLKSSRRKLNQPRPLLIIAHSLSHFYLYANN